jgi:hypothetical protein
LLKLKKFIDDFVTTRHVEARKNAYHGPRTKFRIILDYWEETVKHQRKVGGVLADYMKRQNDKVALLKQRNRELRVIPGASPRDSRRDIVMNPDILEKYMPSGLDFFEDTLDLPSGQLNPSFGNRTNFSAPGLSSWDRGHRETSPQKIGTSPLKKSNF